ncbi:MAG: hypothetical protein ACM3ME_03180 [Chloroflexota bacterium]|nr:hypothetical protein [Lentimicrobium sp.]
MKKITLLLLALWFGTNVISQNCDSFFATEKGVFMEMKSYNDKGKLTGTTRQTITDVRNIDDGIVIAVNSEQFDSKDKSLGKSDLEMRCEGGIFYMDMKNFMNQGAMGDQNAEMKVDAHDLVFPSKMTVGETLPDGSMTISMAAGPIPMNMSIKIFNRKVAAIENVTTPAGTFECYKVNYDMESKMGMKITTSVIQWYAKNTGAVRTETYDKNGKLMGYSELSSYHK